MIRSIFPAAPARRPIAVLTAAVLAAATLAVPAFAQDSAAAGKPDAPQAGKPPGEGQGAAKGEDGEARPDFAAVTAGMEAMPGLMSLYRYKPTDAMKDPTRLFCAVPRALIGQDLLFATSISRGNLAGWQWVDGLVRWEVVGKQLVLVAPDTRFIERPDQPITGAVERTYQPNYLFALPIITMTPTGDPVIDLGAAIFSPAIQTPGLDASKIIRRDLSSLESVKVFPDNLVIDANLAINDRGGTGGTTAGLSYAFRRLPDLKSYHPRKADERVGYFTTVRQDWSTKYDQREAFTRLINRWDVKKKDPTLAMSPPAEPIVFVIQKSVPLQWRKYVADGILEWNKAFEQIGIQDAIVVQQQTDDNEFAGADPADARYNFIQWTVRGVGLAVGPSRPDPRTGQILDADIVVDDTWIRIFNNQSDLFTPHTLAAMLGPDSLEFWSKHPAYMPPGLTKESIDKALGEMNQTTELLTTASAAVSPASVANVQSRRQCSFAVGMVQQLAVAQMIGEQANATTKPGEERRQIPDSIIGNALKEVITHEVGHTLGLRHNFKASAWLTMDEVKKHRDAGEPFVASVMDYSPLAFFTGDDLSKIKSFASDPIGPYDYWAIKYGYAQPAEGQPEGDLLKKIASENTKKELAYATDEDTIGLRSPDPLVNRYDLSSDPIAYAKSRIALSDALLKDFKSWAEKAEAPQYYFRSNFSQIMFERSRNLGYVARMVGGQYFTRNRLGDPNAQPPLTMVDPKSQRAALEMLDQTVFSPDFYTIDPATLRRLTPSRWDDWASDANPRIDFAYHDFVAQMYGQAMFDVCSPVVLQRVYDAEKLQSGDDRFTAAELIKGVRDSLWKELDKPDGKWTDAKPMISSVRRNMQDTHLAYLLATAESAPGDVLTPDLRNMVRFSLRELSDRIAGVLGDPKDPKNAASKIDFASRAHLSEVRNRIERTLNAPIFANTNAAKPGADEGQSSAK